MNINYKKGDLFETTCQAIVNTVNCVGVMGKGVALEFKNRWPENYKAYKKLCNEKAIKPGKMFVFDTNNLFDELNNPPRFIINFPTKAHWRNKSKMSYIEEGLDDLIIQLDKYKIESVALPYLGCGNGGLYWPEVKTLIEHKLSSIDNVTFFIYAPKKDSLAPEHESIPLEGMTRERALLVKAIAELEPCFGGHLTKTSLQKIVYFLHTMGLNYNIDFSNTTHGLYSDTLHKALKSMENKGFIANYLRSNQEEQHIQVQKGALAEADTYLENNGTIEEDNNLINRLSMLIQGYESPYGMQLLSSVHYLATCEKKLNTDQIIKEIPSSFENEAIEVAYHRLDDDGFLNDTSSKNLPVT